MLVNTAVPPSNHNKYYEIELWEEEGRYVVAYR
jgi:hypothetical protein